LEGRFRLVPAPIPAGLDERRGKFFFNFQKKFKFKFKFKIPKMKNKDLKI